MTFRRKLVGLKKGKGGAILGKKAIAKGFSSYQRGRGQTSRTRFLEDAAGSTAQKKDLIQCNDKKKKEKREEPEGAVVLPKKGPCQRKKASRAREGVKMDREGKGGGLFLSREKGKKRSSFPQTGEKRSFFTSERRKGGGGKVEKQKKDNKKGLAERGKVEPLSRGRSRRRGERNGSGFAYNKKEGPIGMGLQNAEGGKAA